jgi:U-box domain
MPQLSFIRSFHNFQSLHHWKLGNSTFEHCNNMTSVSNSRIPSEFICPLTKNIMNDPMMSKTGQNYERDAIVAHLDAGNETCPVTNQPLRISNLISNKTLQWKIQEWRNMNGNSFGEKSILSPVSMVTQQQLLPTQALSSFACLDILAALERDSMPCVLKSA